MVQPAVAVWRPLESSGRLRAAQRGCGCEIPLYEANRLVGLRHILACAFFGLVAMSIVPAATGAGETVEPEIRELLHALARTPPALTRYVERRESPLLIEPLIFQGQLEQPGFDALVKTVEGDHDERLEIVGDRVRVSRSGQRTRSFSLRRAPELAALSDSMSALLAGDVDALLKLYVLRWSRQDAQWQISLSPREARLRKRVVGMQLLGSGSTWHCLDLQLEGGELSRMWLGGAASRAAEAADEAARDALCAAPESK